MHVLITGATGGIGRALARYYAKKGCKLSLLARDSVLLAKLQVECEALGAKVLTLSACLRDINALRQAVTDAEAFWPVDLLIANAGVAHCLAERHQLETWPEIEVMLDVNLRAAIGCVHQLVPAMRLRQSGQIALVSSLAGHVGMPVSPTYCATKAGVKAYGEAMRAALCDDGISVSVVLPGFVVSNMSAAYPKAKPLMISAEKAAKIMAAGIAKKRARIAFPVTLAMGAWVLSVLPSRFSSFLLARFS